MLFLLYIAEHKKCLGFIPNDQAAFLYRFIKVIRDLKASQTMNKLQQGGAAGPSGLSNTNQQHVMQQKNTIAMAGGQITQNFQSNAATMQNGMRLPVCCISFCTTYFTKHSFLVNTARCEENVFNAKV